MLDDGETWAVVGLSGDPSRTAYSIARLLQQRGKRIVPVHRRCSCVHGERGTRRSADIPFPVDVVDCSGAPTRRTSSPTRPWRSAPVGSGSSLAWSTTRRSSARAGPAYRWSWTPARPSVASPVSDLHVPSGPGLPDGLVVPVEELVERFSRSSGPGGQSVNTTDSRVSASRPARRRILTPAERDLVGTIRSSPPSTAPAPQPVAARDRLGGRDPGGLAPPPPTRVPTSRRSPPAAPGRGRSAAATATLRGRVRD